MLYRALLPAVSALLRGDNGRPITACCVTPQALVARGAASLGRRRSLSGSRQRKGTTVRRKESVLPADTPAPNEAGCNHVDGTQARTGVGGWMGAFWWEVLKHRCAISVSNVAVGLSPQP